MRIHQNHGVTCGNCGTDFPATPRQHKTCEQGRPVYCCEDCRRKATKERKNQAALRRYHEARGAPTEIRVCECGETFVSLVSRNRRRCARCLQSSGTLRITPMRDVPEYGALNMGTGYPATHAINCPVL